MGERHVLLRRPERVLSRHRRRPVRGTRLEEPVELQVLRSRQARPREDHARAPAVRRGLLAQLLRHRVRPVRPGHARLPLGLGGHAHGVRQAEAGRRLRVRDQARRAVLLLPRPRHRAGRRHRRRVREEPADHRRAGEGTAAGDWRQAPLGHGEPVLRPALHERRGDQSRLPRAHARGGPGQGGHRRHDRTRRTGLRLLGRTGRLLVLC